MKGTRPVRVLHVLAGLAPGGVETFLMNLLRSMDQARYRFDFLLNQGAAGAFDAEAEAYGATLHRGPVPQRPVAYARRLRHLLGEAEYDAVHSHLFAYSGLVLWVARRAGVPVRIAHTHTRPRGRPPLLRRAYLGAMRASIRRHATHGFAVTGAAAGALFGPGWRDDPRFAVLPMGFDFSPFESAPGRAEARAALGIPSSARVVAHIGGMSPQKNHGFVLDVVAALAADRDDVRLAALTRHRGELAGLVERRGLAGRCVLPPSETPAPVVLAAADLLLLPSVWEGLPVVVLEAQAAGVPVLGSPAVPDEAVVIPELVHRRDLGDGAAAWAAAAARMLDHPPEAPARPAARVGSAFGLEQAWQVLDTAYGGSSGRA